MGFNSKYNQPQTEYQYGPIDTGKGGGSINTGSKGKPSAAPKEKPAPKENTADADRKADDAYMAEPTEMRGTESGAYDGLDISQLRDRANEEV